MTTKPAISVGDDAGTTEFPVVATFDIRYRQYLDSAAHVVHPLPDNFQQPSALLPLYRAMVLTRLVDAKCVALQRTGRLGTYATALGQEAVPIGVASAMVDSDVLVPSYREGGAQLWRGVSLDEYLLYWTGDERGSNWSGPREDFPVSITVGGHALHAVGVATAIKLREQQRGVVSVFGDAATSKGDVYESMNLAGVWQLPVVFVITNNQWAISTPLKAQTAAQTLAQKAVAAGFAGEQVDGNDVIAVHQSVSEALVRARAGQGATLIEAVTYRLNDHNTADDSTRYRDPEEVKQHWEAEPIKRLKNYLNTQGVWSDEDEQSLQAQCSAQIEVAVQQLLKVSPQQPEAMFDHLYAVLPAAYEKQREHAIKDGE